MEALTETNVVTSRVMKTELIDWKTLQFIQQENFKELDKEAKQRLKNSIVANNFTQPFYVWRDCDNQLWCLDGKHRSLLLEDLINDGVQVPSQLPATFIKCSDKKDAARLVLLFSSQYARVTTEGLFDFITLNELEFEELKDMMDSGT